jgi:hypothetical protein
MNTATLNTVELSLEDKKFRAYARIMEKATRSHFSEIGKATGSVEVDYQFKEVFIPITDSNYGLSITSEFTEVFTNYTASGKWQPLRNQLRGEYHEVVKELKRRIAYWETKNK